MRPIRSMLGLCWTLGKCKPGVLRSKQLNELEVLLVSSFEACKTRLTSEAQAIVA